MLLNFGKFTILNKTICFINNTIGALSACIGIIPKQHEKLIEDLLNFRSLDFRKS